MPPRGGKRKSKKSKKKKDPKKPKRAMSSFMFFANDKRNEVRAANPDLKITEVGKKLGEMWKSLIDSDKKKYEEQAAQDKERYSKAMEGYTPPSDDSESEDDRKKKRRKTKPKRDPKKTKESNVFFYVFCKRKER